MRRRIDGARQFNVTGVCIPKKHYMVDISSQLGQIRELVDRGSYFTINRARQYGKTTTLAALAKLLADDYLAISLDFQAFDAAKFADGHIFSVTFAQYFLRRMQMQPLEIQSVLGHALAALQAAVAETGKAFSLYDLFQYLTQICSQSPKPVILIIDEIDRAASNQVFLDFLSQLRNYYLERDTLGTATFHSVILAGVYDVRNLKTKFRPDEEHSFNSPWNIAAKFNVNMSFSKTGIAGMLKQYESDWHTGMQAHDMAGLLFGYTSGYPFLVSALCKLMDEDVSRMENFGSKKAAWTKAGFLEAERILLSEKNTLFESLMGKLRDYPKLNVMLEKLLFTGTDIPYNAYEPAIDIATMSGFIRERKGVVEIANRIFETWLYNLYLSGPDMEALELCTASQRDRNQFIRDGHLDMRHILERFTVHFHDLYKDSRDTFIESIGRKFFLLYLRPIINGTGNYYIESQTRDLGRTDLVVDYHGEQFIVELKIWHGEAYNRRGEEQLLTYMESYHANTGYMVSFNFNKKKEVGVHEIVVGDKMLIEVVV